ncbi:hypothetical protein PPERSA_12613 [Pseudocohnilembus persalinus]|uniref:Uncharacterized protein n=1 Tax=Pseudocohnilembus persalinus TaxID=266149 RepID=A0A0V0QCP4_PSEPJ|nr:hypothetical protein PPERSA_12613 [Pseudocohnilembus persalinus]|eukprot:KRW99937.1 hypothetical protein PPERSA_12613 [Pseudocohnilembus persalinus]
MIQYKVHYLSYLCCSYNIMYRKKCLISKAYHLSQLHLYEYFHQLFILQQGFKCRQNQCQNFSKEQISLQNQFKRLVQQLLQKQIHHYQILKLDRIRCLIFKEKRVELLLLSCYPIYSHLIKSNSLKQILFQY